MCFNAEISLITYIIGCLSCYNLYLLDYKIEALYFLWIVNMQLIEYLFWINLKCNNTNKFLTKIAIVLNHTQPLILYLLINYNNNKIPDYVHKIAILYTVICILFSYYDIITDNCSIVNKDISPHINWKWNSNKYHKLFYILFITVTIILFKFIPDFKHNHYYSRSEILIIIYLTSYSISYMIYDEQKNVGSMWCFFAALAPLILPTIYDINHLKN
jgi:hypothetical protein